jgi:hypothetical protein
LSRFGVTRLNGYVFGALDRIIPARENSVSISSRLHVALGMACLLGIAVHLALHSKWITSTIKSNLQVKREDMVIILPGGVKDLTISNR